MNSYISELRTQSTLMWRKRLDPIYQSMQALFYGGLIA